MNVNVGPGNLWTRAVANRITAERLERDAHEKHLSALRHVKCSIDNRPPPTHTHLANKLKTKKLQEDRRMLNRLQAAAPSIDPMRWEQDEVEREHLKARICQNANRYRRGPSLKMPRTTGEFRQSEMQGTTD